MSDGKQMPSVEPDPHAYRPSSLDPDDAAEMRVEAERDLAESRRLRSHAGPLPWFAGFFLVGVLVSLHVNGRAAPCTALACLAVVACSGLTAVFLHVRSKRLERRGHDTMRILENGLDAVDYQRIMGRPHPWKMF